MIAHIFWRSSKTSPLHTYNPVLFFFFHPAGILSSLLRFPPAAAPFLLSPPLPRRPCTRRVVKGFVNQEAVLALVSRRLGDFLGDGAIELSQEERGAVPLSFYGISQGAILGAGYTEFSSLVRLV